MVRQLIEKSPDMSKHEHSDVDYDSIVCDDDAIQFLYF